MLCAGIDEIAPHAPPLPPVQSKSTGTQISENAFKWAKLVWYCNLPPPGGESVEMAIFRLCKSGWLASAMYVALYRDDNGRGLIYVFPGLLLYRTLQVALTS